MRHLLCTQFVEGVSVSQTVGRVYSDLHREILTGKRRPGARLREEEIAETFGVSRTPVREALRRLSSDGLVELVPHRGAEVVRWAVDDVEELFDLRCLLEGHAARRAAERGGADPERLRDLCARMEAHLGDADGRADEITRLNLELHRAVHHAGGRVLSDLVTRVLEVPLVRRTFDEYSADEMRRSFTQHRELVDAIAEGDGEWAQAVMRAHIRAAAASWRAHRALPDSHPDQRGDAAR
jgi:DNA-binding GntR family transcriptional regulator